MHVPDGFMSGAVNGACAAGSAAALGWSLWRLRSGNRLQAGRAPLMATTAAFVFAAQMLNFPIGGGTSGHFLGAATVAALLGASGSCLVMTLVLVVQCLMFADGGITALGTNIFNMGVIGGLGAYLMVRPLRRALPGGRAGYLIAAGLASWLSVMAASSACAVELSLSGTSPLRVALPAMAVAHAVIGVGEALICVAVLGAVAAARPDVLPEWALGAAGTDRARPEGRRSGVVWPLAGAGLGLSIILGAFISPFASPHPDGLEKVAEEKGFAAAAEGGETWESSPLPDYAVPGVASEGVSTGLAGILGTALVFAVGFAAIRLVAAARRRAVGPAESRKSG